jgi:sugar O-acyltransferase (sialic acid O-acetyltransferase NeuD family)
MAQHGSTSTQPIVVYGAGGHGREFCQLVIDAIGAGAPFVLAGLLDDDARLHGGQVGGVPVLGGASWLEGKAQTNVVLAVGAPARRQQGRRKLETFSGRFPALVHPSVVIGPRVELSDGVVVCAGNVLTCDIAVGEFANINVCCSVNHDARIGPYATLAPGVRLAGNVTIEAGAEIGIGASIIPGTTVGEWAVVGAGAAVTRSVSPNSTAVGVPARTIKARPAGWQNH